MPSTLHVELVEQTPTALQLRLWRDNPNELRTRTLELAEIAALVTKAETDYYSPLPAKLQEIERTVLTALQREVERYGQPKDGGPAPEGHSG